MVLLTSSQASVAISSAIVFVFTLALFLSGYVLQQKTVNDIRAVIKPHFTQPQSDLYLPPQFRDGEFWDGKEVLEIDAENIKAPSDIDDKNGDNNDDLHDDEDMIGATRWQKAAKKKEKLRLQEEAAKQKLISGTKDSNVGKSKSEGKFGEDQPLSRAERRKKIKAEIMAAGEGEGPNGYRRKWM